MLSEQNVTLFARATSFCLIQPRVVHFLWPPSKFVRCSESAYLRQKRLAFLATRSRYLGIIPPVDRFFYRLGPAANLSSPRTECFTPLSPSLSSPSPRFSLSLFLIQCTFYSDLACWQVFFFLVACIASRAVKNGRLPLPTASHGRQQPGPVSGPAFRSLWSFADASSIARTSSLLRGYGPFVVPDTWRRGDTYAEGTQRGRPHLIPGVL